MTCLFRGVWRSVEVEMFPASLLLLGEEGAQFPLTCLVGCVCRTVSLSAGAGPTPAGLPDPARPGSAGLPLFIIARVGATAGWKRGRRRRGVTAARGGLRPD